MFSKILMNMILVFGPYGNLWGEEPNSTTTAVVVVFNQWIYFKICLFCYFFWICLLLNEFIKYGFTTRDKENYLQKILAIGL